PRDPAAGRIALDESPDRGRIRVEQIANGREPLDGKLAYRISCHARADVHAVHDVADVVQDAGCDLRHAGTPPQLDGAALCVRELRGALANLLLEMVPLAADLSLRAVPLADLFLELDVRLLVRPFLLGLALVELRVLDRYGDLCKENVQRLEPGRGECAGDVIVLEVEHAAHAALVSDRRTQDGLRPLPANVAIVTEVRMLGRLVQHDQLLRADDVVHDPGRDILRVAEADTLLHDRRARRRLARPDEQLAFRVEHERSGLGAGVLDDDVEQRHEQPIEADLARDGLARL